MTGNNGPEAFGRCAVNGRTSLPLAGDEWTVLNVVAEHREIRGTAMVADLAFGRATASRDERVMRVSKALTGLRDYRLVEWSESEGGAVLWRLASGVCATNLALLFARSRPDQG
ncbi:hypothetical protein [Paraburkholderia humisilvae]|uniref:Uncharacterized protein n=1 Tax=Paraburkholderia humisilvae TaxID=627669 RepID=A0A6J5DKX0_9BURK|nr:hypothetical protein [Paraburkholderia humisilvae]CAB3754623.1 hypothetical protein LMG29542_02402 [Paraburkholderia humisilvae]